VRDDLLRSYREGNGMSSWRFPDVPNGLRDALRVGLPPGADKEGESLLRVWQKKNKQDSALSKVALRFLLNRFDVDKPVVRAVMDAMDREGSPQEMPLVPTAPPRPAPRSALVGARARATTANDVATPRLRGRTRPQFALGVNQPVTVEALTTGGATTGGGVATLSLTGSSVHFCSQTTVATKRTRGTTVQTPTSKGSRGKQSPQVLSGQRSNKRPQIARPVNLDETLMCVTPGASSGATSTEDPDAGNLVLDLVRLTAAAKEAAGQSKENCAAATTNLLAVGGLLVPVFEGESRPIVFLSLG
jgi:hypothetical protein